jgi:hypothetical protein
MITDKKREFCRQKGEKEMEKEERTGGSMVLWL